MMFINLIDNNDNKSLIPVVDVEIDEKNMFIICGIEEIELPKLILLLDVQQIMKIKHVGKLSTVPKDISVMIMDKMIEQKWEMGKHPDPEIILLTTPN